MSLREQIEAKQRRTAKLPILVGDLAAATAEVGNLITVLAVLDQAPAEEKAKPAHKRRVAKAKKDLEAARERQDGCVVEVELQAMPADDWEALVGPLEPDEAGELDLSQIHAVALGASCVDPDLQDSEWWQLQFKQPHWTQGDRAAISQVLMQLNWFAPSRIPGKG